ncbi:universal stress protein [Arthrobacter cavernae]|uniref:Universal stress protein n=1 Tax=Arthrobacter cavernae TaxID=2817681 RepID=A0A939KJW5_9MICC|nr:universal stress protein [Arthrobacter cavernae]MBO1269112.1 universal stress protein [Arthrobacter cavernae]
MRYVVGYTPNERGADAVALASSLARAQDAELDLVYVLKTGIPGGALRTGGSLSPGDQDVLAVERQGLALVPDGVPATFRAVPAESLADGLIQSAGADTGLIVVGAASNGLFKRFTVGSVANGLLHASPVPVALAPRGFNRTEPVTRFTLATGQRAGADAAIGTAVGAANRRGVPLRLVSLVTLDAGTDDGGEATNAAHRHANTVLSDAASRLPEGHDVTVAVAHGRSIEEAIDSLEWLDGEVMVIGSSRLAEKNRLFIGSTANKILRALPVPMVVVPRDYERVDSMPI